MIAAMKTRKLLAALGGAALLLSGCSDRPEDDTRPKGDPAQAAALADPIMIDRELSGQNKAEAAIAGGGPPAIELPEVTRDPAFIAAARDEAKMAAGGAIQSAPRPNEAEIAGAGAVTPGQLAVLAGASAKCSGMLGYSASWALRLPQPLAIYPRGHLREAAGARSDGCNLVVASFVTPVDLHDIADFYHTRLKSAGYNAGHHLASGANVLTASKGSTRLAVRIRTLEDGLTGVDLVAAGS
jgi:hypothetical protein